MAEHLPLKVYADGLVGTLPFVVNIASSKTVGDLKNAILMQGPNTLKGVDLDQLALYKVELPDNEDLERSVALAPRKQLEVMSCVLSKIFLVKPSAEMVSIILDIKGRCLRLVMHQSRDKAIRIFFCLIEGDNVVFKARIGAGETVADLKEIIHKKGIERPILAKNLTLLMVDIDLNTHTRDSLSQLAIKEGDGVQMLDWTRVSEIWPNQPADRRLHIFVKLPHITATIKTSSSNDSNLLQNLMRRFSGARLPPHSDMWSPRTETVKGLYNALLEWKLIYVRGTPACGKTTLMLLLDAHIRRINPSAFVYRILSWKLGSSSESEARIKEIDHLHLRHGGLAFLLFDDAQDTYDDDFLWPQFFKAVVAGVLQYHVVVFCSYGSPSTRPVDTKSGTSPVLHDEACITLWPKTKPDGEIIMNGLLLNQQEFNQVVERYGSLNIHSDLSQRIFDWTNGHAGAVVVFLDLILNKTKMKSRMRKGEVITVETFDKEFSLNDIMVALHQGAFGRGIPSSSDDLTAEVTEVFRRLLKDGAIQVSRGYDDPAIRTCHRRGWIYAKRVTIDGLRSSLFYVFASPLHAVVLSWMLDPTDDMPDFQSPLDLCTTVISKFNPSQLKSPMRHVGACFSERPPEAHYQDEFYRCLFDLTHGSVSISPEFATAQKVRKAGRIDFFIPRVRWGIELTRDGDRLNEHALRFGANGAYGKWMEDGHMTKYILLDFRTRNVSDPHPNIPFLYHVVFQNDYQQVWCTTIC
ncbi:hypothetical protein APHAL10511_005364 [Amanita phalloides]|nr:hypothetical protein APHAL10511_005364 [Amanita phalloides]